MPTPGKFYVLGVYGNPFVLTEKPVALKDAQSAVRWQTGGTYPHPDYRVTLYDPKTRRFVDFLEPDKTYEAHRGPYTEKAFSAFLASLPAQ
jgi:hypothetical protein